MDPYRNNVTLLNLLSQYPIVRGIAQELPFAGLLNLARLNSEYRNILHGFPREAMELDHCMVRNGARQGLHLGEHETKHWRNLKTLSRMVCSEPKHTKGSNPRGCRMCSKPVCEGCIVKASFGKHEKTFQNRRRQLCPECWATSNPLRESPIEPVHVSKPVSYTPCYPCHQGALVFRGYCSCTARDWWLCLECKTAQRPDLQAKPKICAGQSCSNLLDETGEELRACLWCHLPLEGRPSQGESRRDYDSRHLYARSTSNTWPAEDELFSSANHQLSNESSTAGNRQRSFIPYSDQRYYLSKDPSIKTSVSFPFSSPPKLKVRAPRPLPNLMLIDYSSLGVPPPTAHRMVDSVFGTFCYDLDFLLAFRPLCCKEPTPDWEARVVNAFLQPNDTGLVAAEDDDDEVLVLDEGEGSDEATLHPYDGDDNDDDSDEATLANARISSDYSFTSREPWVWSLRDVGN